MTHGISRRLFARRPSVTQCTDNISRFFARVTVTDDLHIRTWPVCPEGLPDEGNCENEPRTSRLSKVIVWQTDKQTDTTEIITTDAPRVVRSTFCNEHHLKYARIYTSRRTVIHFEALLRNWPPDVRRRLSILLLNFFDTKTAERHSVKTVKNI